MSAVDEHRVAVVTGAGSGLGRAIAGALHGRGYRVVVADRDVEAARRTVAELGEHTVARGVDVRDTAGLADLLDEVEREIGPVDVWVNNAGVMPTGRFTEQDLDVLDLVVDVDLRAVVHATRLVLPRMLERRRGSVVQVASATGRKPMAGLAVYSGAKAGVIGFTSAVRRELRGSGVHVGVVLPYLAATPMGEGIAAQRGFRAVTPAQVSDEVLRLLDRRAFAAWVPRRLGAMSRVFEAMPLSVQDRLDDWLLSDRIGLGCGRPE